VRPPRHRAARFFRRREDLEQLHLCLGVPGLAETHRSRYTLHVLNAVLGSTMSGRLFQRIREEHGLVYNVYSAANGFSDTGAFVVYAATRPGKGADVLRLVVEELRRLARERPADEEMEVARNHLKGRARSSTAVRRRSSTPSSRPSTGCPPVR
jgi:predicted Zn-dependent peptidase